MMEATVIVSCICAVLGAVVGVSGYRRSLKGDGISVGQQQADIEYIRRRIDDILLEQRTINAAVSAHAERIAKLEEAVESLQSRI